MNIQDNVIKTYLRNVCFVTGTPCGGKTTVTRALGERYGIPVYNIDEAFERHRALSDPACQPNMNKTFADADEFFGRTVGEYEAWLAGTTREQLDFVLLDLIRLSQNGRILCDCHLTLEQAEQLTDRSGIVFLLQEPSDIARTYAERPDHKGFRDYLNSASDPEKAKALYSEVLIRRNVGFYHAVRNSGWFFIDRAEGLSVEETVRKVADHFGLNAADPVSVEKVERDTPRAEELLRFIETCSWEEAKDHLAALIRTWDFTGDEAVFAAVADGRIVGMTTFLMTDYYPLPDVFPWVSSVFVDEAYRGRRISEKLIGCANAYAKSLGYEKTYIPSSFFGLYEKYGYRYLGDIVNYGGDSDHLFVKEL